MTALPAFKLPRLRLLPPQPHNVPLLAQAGPRTYLRRTTLGVLAAISFVTLAAFALASYLFFLTVEGATWQVQQAETADRISENIGTFLSQSEQLIGLVDALETTGEVFEAAEFEELIDAMLASTPAIREIVLTDADGSIIASRSQTTPILDNQFTLPQSIWFQTARDGQRYLSDVQFAADQAPYVILALPGTNGRIVAALLQMDVLREVLAVTDEETPNRPNYIVHRDGGIILHPDVQYMTTNTRFPDEAAFAALADQPNYTFTQLYTSFGSTAVMGSSNDVENTDWVVIRETDTSEVFVNSTRLGLIVAAVLFVLWLLILAGANSFLNNLYFSPMDNLQQGSQIVKTGTLDHRVPIRYNDEMGILTDSFNTMVNELQTRTTTSETLFGFSQKFANAHVADDIVQALYEYAKAPDLTGVTMSYIDNDADGEPSTMTVTAIQQPPQAIRVLFKGQKFAVSDFPFFQMLNATQDAILIENVETDTRVDPTLKSIIQASNTAANVFLPVTQAGRWIAIISISWEKPRTFTATDVDFYRALPTLIAPVADNLRLIAQLEDNIQQVVLARGQSEQLLDVSKRLANARTNADIVDTVFDFSPPEHILSTNIIYIDNDATGKPEYFNIDALRMVDDRPPAMPTGMRFPVTQFPLASVMLNSSQQPLIIEDVSADERLESDTKAILSAVKAQSAVFIPITQSGRWVAVLAILWLEARTFSEEQKAFFTGLPTLLAPVADNLRLIGELETNIAQLSEARARAEESSRLKGEFLSTMSHELRTPLNAIEGFTGIMLTGMGGFDLQPEARRMTERVRLNSRRLLGLVNDFLDLSRIEAGRVDIVNEPVQPAKMAARWAAEVGGLAESKGLKLITEIDPTLPDTVLADEDALNKIASNLLSNAIKFTETGEVHLRMFVQGDQWALEVADTGIGIPQSAQDYIFDEFRQVDGTTTRKYGGTGLGLAIARKFVRLMNGTIQLESTVDQGSTFTVHLPLLLPVSA